MLLSPSPYFKCLCLLLGVLYPVQCDDSDLYLLVLSPYPSDRFADAIGWAGGPALYPAAELAADMINNSTDILPRHTLRLINGDSGCAFHTRATETFAREAALKTGGRKVMGIVGPACSSAALEIGGVTGEQYADIISITVSNGPLLRIANLTNMFRLHSSARLLAYALLELMQLNGWKSVATVIDITHWYYTQIYSSFRSNLTTTLEYNAQQLALQNGIVPFNSIHNAFNVIVVFAGTTESRNSLCIAYHLKFLYPDYQWIFLEVELEGILTDAKVYFNGMDYSCSEQEMRIAANQAIIIHERLIPEDKMTQTDVGLTYSRFSILYESYYRDHLHLESISRGDIPVGAKDWAASYFDCLWAFGLALDKIIKGNMTLNYSISQMLHKHLLALNFTGLTGQVNFDPSTLEGSSTFDVCQADTTYTAKTIGYYHKNKLFITSPENASFVAPIRKEIIRVRLEIVAIFFPASLVILIILGFLHFIYIAFHHYQSIRAQSPQFIHLIFSGCYLYILASLLDTVRAANWTGSEGIESPDLMVSLGTLCNVIFWCITLSTTLIFGTMCVLSWRIYRIFSHFTSPGKFIADPYLAGIVIVLLAIDVAVLVSWSSSDPLLPHFVVASSGLRAGVLPHYAHCDCNYFFSWLSVWLLNESLIVMVVLFAILNRHVPKKDFVNNTRSHNGTVYIMSFINGICVPIYFVLSRNKHINTSYIFFQFFTLGSPLTACIVLFLPPVLPLLRTAWLKLCYCFNSLKNNIHHYDIVCSHEQQ